MYESPIEIFVKEMRMKQEEQVLKAVQEIGVHIDKDELVKALKYDREQYEKGFADGRNSCAQACRVGDTVYQTDGVRIYQSTIKKIIYDTDAIAFDESAIGKTIFLTREEAEGALDKIQEDK